MSHNKSLWNLHTSLVVFLAVLVGLVSSAVPAKAAVSAEIDAVKVTTSGNAILLDSNANTFSKDLWSQAEATLQGYTLPTTSTGATPVTDSAFLGSWVIQVNGVSTTVTSGNASSDGWHFTLNIGATVMAGDTVSVSYTSNTASSDADDYFALCFQGNPSCSPTLIADFSTTATNLSTVMPQSSDASATFTVNGTAQISGDTINVAAGTTSVTVLVTPTDSNATYVVSGDTGLTTGSNPVTVVVTAQDGSTSVTSTFTVWVAADYPSNFVVTPIGGGVQLSWTNNGALYTNFNFSSGSGWSYAPNSQCANIPSSATSCTVTGLPVGVTYTFIAYTQMSPGGDGGSGWSGVLGQFTTLALSSDASATFTVNGTSQISGDTINVAAGTTSVTVGVTPNESHATYVVSGDTGLTTGSNPVTVVVTAQDGTTSVTSTFTVVVAAPANSAPVLGSGTTASPNAVAGTGATVYSNTATDADNDPITYSLTGNDSAGFSVSSGGVITSLNSTAAGTYTFTLEASDSNGGTDSESVTVTIDAAAPANSAPVLGSGTTASPNAVAGTGATVYSNTATDADNDPITYSLTGNDSAGFSVSSGGVITSLNSTAAGTYTFTLEASDSNGGTDSESVTVTIDAAPVQAPSSSPSAPAATAPSEPTGASTVAGNGQVTVTWSAPSSTGGAAISSYLVEYSADNGVTWVSFPGVTSTSLSAVVTGLTNGKAYIFRVRALNSVGTSNASLSSTPATPIAPTVTLGKSGRIAFSAGSSKLTTSTKSLIKKFFSNVESQNLDVVLTGSTKVAKSNKTATALAMARALSVKKYLMSLGFNGKYTLKTTSTSTYNQVGMNVHWIQ